MLIQRFSRVSLLGRKRLPPAHLGGTFRQFNDEVRLPWLDAQVGPDCSRSDRSRRVSDLPCPGRSARIIRVVVFPNVPSECLGQEDGNLGCHLIQSDNTDVVGGRLAARTRSLVPPRYQNGAVTVDATGDIGPQGFVHDSNSTGCPQCHQLGTVVAVKQLGAVLGADYGAGKAGSDMAHWPSGVRVREFPRTEAVPA